MVNIKGKIKTGTNITGDVSGKGIVDGRIEKPETIYEKEVVFGNYFEFPAIGVENMLYVAKDTHKTYFFDAEKLVYQVVGSDYEEIEIIQSTL